VTSSIWPIETKNTLTTQSQGMKHGAFLYDPQTKWQILNINHHHHHHHFEAKNFKSRGIKER
jgi:predicted transposase YbfD/YdcC